MSEQEKHKKKKEQVTVRSSAAEYLNYVASVGNDEQQIEIRYEDENIWLTQKLMAMLYGVEVHTINYHIKKIFSDSELQETAVIRKFRITAPDGKQYTTNHYSLEMIIAVGFKVNSEKAVQFRKWVNGIAKEYTIKGWVMDSERLKRGTYLTDKYFDEQLERIREIRISERLFYQKITDLYATAIDYDKTALATRRFYATVQNKMHFAAHGHTAAEVIYDRANAEKDFMGLTTWRGAIPTKHEAEIAKNYLSEEEVDMLNRIVNLYLDFAELQAKSHVPMYMKDWIQKLDDFLKLSGKELLNHAGSVSAEVAKLKANEEYDKFRERAQYKLSPVEIHFLEAFEAEQKRLRAKK